MNVLIISWYFPPWNEVASNRPYSWAKRFAAKGHSVTVLTPEKRHPLHLDLSSKIPPDVGFRMAETPLRLLKTPIAKGASWAASSLNCASQLAAKSDVIISTFMPWYIHVLGRRAKSANPKAYWCADYRDLWHDYDFYTDGKPLRRLITKAFEKRVVRQANLTTSVSAPLCERLAVTHPHIPSHIIYNGFPADEYRPPQQECERKARAQAQKPFRILYAGTLYDGGFHNPEPLFQAIAAKQWTRPIELHFLGKSAKSTIVKNLTKKYGLESCVKLGSEQLPRQACVQLQREVDVLLHLGWTNSGMNGVLSAKIFEYMAAGVPILSIGAPSGSAIDILLSRAGSGACIGLDSDRALAILKPLILQGYCSDWFAPQKEQLMEFSRETQADRLLELLLEGHRKLQQV